MFVRAWRNRDSFEIIGGNDPHFPVNFLTVSHQEAHDLIFVLKRALDFAGDHSYLSFEVGGQERAFRGVDSG